MRTGADRGETRISLETLDDTPVLTVDHDDAAAFFPDPERIYSHEGVDH